VFDSDGKVIKGVPFRAAELYKKTGTRDAHSKGGACNPVIFVEIISLPTGTQYYVNVETKDLAKSEFTVRLNANGALSEVTMNSEPAAAEQIKAGAELLQTVLSAASGLPAAAAAAPAPPAAPGAPAKACDKGEKNVEFTKFTPTS